MAKSYAFNPIPAGMDKSLQYKILGLGCQMWGEQILTVESMNRMTFLELQLMQKLVGYHQLEKLHGIPSSINETGKIQ